MLLQGNRNKMIALIVEGLGGHRGPRVPYVQKMGEEAERDIRLPDSDFALEKAMEKLCMCMEQKDYRGMAQAIREAMEICETPYGED